MSEEIINPSSLGLDDISLPPHKPGQAIGLFGGSFNPPHEGHVTVSSEVKKLLALDQIWWLITPGNPLKDTSSLLSVAERQKRAEKLIASSDIHPINLEEQLGHYYSWQTITWLKTHLPQCHFVWIMGVDNLINFHDWYRWQDILTSLPLAIYDRPGFEPEARQSTAMEILKPHEINLEEIDSFLQSPPPIWTYLRGQTNAQSSTLIRESDPDWMSKVTSSE